MRNAHHYWCCACSVMIVDAARIMRNAYHYCCACSVMIVDAARILIKWVCPRSLARALLATPTPSAWQLVIKVLRSESGSQIRCVSSQWKENARSKANDVDVSRWVRYVWLPHEEPAREQDQGGAVAQAVVSPDGLAARLPPRRSIRQTGVLPERDRGEEIGRSQRYALTAIVDDI